MRNYLRALSIVLIGLGALCSAYAGQAGQSENRTQKPFLREADRHMESKRKVVFHLDWDQEERLLMALENAKNLFKEIPPEQCTVHMVANGKAVHLFRKDRASKYAGHMESLHKQGARFKACRNALANNNVAKEDLLEFCEIVPAGILELIDLQKEGFAYIKP